MNIRIILIIAAALLISTAALIYFVQYIKVPIAAGSKEYTYENREISCLSNGQRIYGIAFIPNCIKGKMPAVILSHGFQGTHKNVQPMAE